MVSLAQLWLPILLAAVLMFVASSLVHMVLKWHVSDYRSLPNEEAVMEAIRKGAPGPGQYFYPYCSDMKEMKSEAMQKKFEQGPIAMITLRAPGRPGMGKAMAQWFLFLLVVSFSVAYLVSRTVPRGTEYLHVFRVAGTVAFLALAAGTVPASIWMGKPWRVTLKEIADGLLYALVAAGTFGWLWPRL
jgi:hypothetical protein